MQSGRRGWSLRAAAAWLKTPAGSVALLIMATFLARVIFASALGLGIDESYMVAAGRELQLSYFDHPPIAWWLAWGAAHLAGSESAIVVRLPFITLFAVATVLMYRVTSALFGPPAGLWAAVVLNLAPVLGITAGTWVLPDGPLVASLLGFVGCLIPALRSSGRSAWGWWLAAGMGAGLALSSKYSAALTIVGAFLFALTEPRSRRWFARLHPYVAGLVGLAMFSPVLIWNAENGWMSLVFQGGRADGAFRPFGPILSLAGHALFLLPWIWLPLILCGLAALRRGPSDWRRWLLVCLAAPPIIVFTAVSLWSHVLFHWAAPGYLMLLPLFGDTIARHRQMGRVPQRWLAATAAFVVLGTMLIVATVRFDWLPTLAGDLLPGKDPSFDVIDWTFLRDDLKGRGLLDRPNVVVAAMRWYEAGKIDYALKGKVPVICLGTDCRQYGVIARHNDYTGTDVLVVTRESVAQVAQQLRHSFDSLEPIAPAVVLHAGHTALQLNLFLGHRLHTAAENCCSS